jgi:hypothetical protein
LSFGGTNNDPALTFNFQNTLQETTHQFIVYFYNLLDELCLPYIINPNFLQPNQAGGGAGPTPTGFGECLDVRSFGAVGDGFTDDTAAIQAALDQAYQNYLANNAAGQTIVSLPGSPGGFIVVGAEGGAIGSPGHLGPTIVCIPSGLVCCVYPTWIDINDLLDGTNPGGSPFQFISNEVPLSESPGVPGGIYNLAHAPDHGLKITKNSVLLTAGTDYSVHGAGLIFTVNVNPTDSLFASYYWDSGSTAAIPKNWNGRNDSLIPNNVGYTCLRIDSGVTLKLDGVLMLGNDRTKSYGRWAAEFLDESTLASGALGQAIYLIENRNAFRGGPWFSQQRFPNPAAIKYDEFLLDYEDPGPRDELIRITGQGVMNCNGRQFWNDMGASFLGSYATGISPNFEVCAIRFVKADNSIIENITVANAVTNTSDVVHFMSSKYATIQSVTVQDTFCDSSVFLAGGSIVMEACRIGVLQLCTLQRLGGAGIVLWGCQRINVLGNTVTHCLWGENGGGTTGGTDMIAVYDWVYNLDWFFSWPSELEAIMHAARRDRHFVYRGFP